ncbi:MAG: NAD(P)H-hydrate epimerase [Phycisphaerae bacterium]|jgi:NAD(P)H-hydrate epimerase
MGIVLTRDQVRSVDQAAIERYRIAGIVLMENAGRNAAAIIRESYGERGEALICCGPGNNGGDGCVIARHLHNAGWAVRLLVTGDAARMAPDMKANFAIVEAMDLDRVVTGDFARQRAAVESARGGEVVVDALLGTGFRGEVRRPAADLIETINTVKKRATVAIDVPSGLDCDSGAPSNATIKADLTVTFVATKAGFLNKTAEPYVGRVEVADIGVPRELIEGIAGSRD